MILSCTNKALRLTGTDIKNTVLICRKKNIVHDLFVVFFMQCKSKVNLNVPIIHFIMPLKILERVQKFAEVRPKQVNVHSDR